jgi:hypothetical protein
VVEPPSATRSTTTPIARSDNTILATFLATGRSTFLARGLSRARLLTTREAAASAELASSTISAARAESVAMSAISHRRSHRQSMEKLVAGGSAQG